MNTWPYWLLGLLGVLALIVMFIGNLIEDIPDNEE